MKTYITKYKQGCGYLRAAMHIRAHLIVIPQFTNFSNFFATLRWIRVFDNEASVPRRISTRRCTIDRVIFVRRVAHTKKMRVIKARKWEWRFSGVSHCGAAAKVPDAPTSKSATHDALETRARPDESRTTPLSIRQFARA